MTREERRSAALRQIRHLKLASLAEAATLALLVLVAVPLKYLAGWDLAVRFLGPIHGFAFVAYVWNVWQSATLVRWRFREVVRLVLAAFVPLGGFLNWSWLVRQTRVRLDP